MSSFEVIYGQGSWGTLSAICFLFSAFFTDLMLIRFWLVMAYGFLILQGALGLPAWYNWTSHTGVFASGMVAFAVVGGILHTAAWVRLLWDERPIRLHSEDEEQLWRLLHRRSGMNRLEFQACAKLGTWVRYEPDEVVFDAACHDQQACLTLNILVDGLVRFAPVGTPDDAFNALYWERLHSGAMFSFLTCNLFGIFLGFESDEMGIVKAETPVLVFQWPFPAVQKMAQGMSPTINGFWRNMLTFQLANELNRTRYKTRGEEKAFTADGNLEDPAFFKGGRSLDLTRPLRDWEMEHFGIKEFFMWIYKTFDLSSPIGIRHNSLPKSGQLAQGAIQLRATLVHLRTVHADPRSVSKPLEDCPSLSDSTFHPGLAYPLPQPLFKSRSMTESTYAAKVRLASTVMTQLKSLPGSEDAGNHTSRQRANHVPVPDRSLESSDPLAEMVPTGGASPASQQDGTVVRNMVSKLDNLASTGSTAGRSPPEP